MYDSPRLIGVDLARVEVDARGLEAGARELDGERQTDVAEADDADVGGAVVELLCRRAAAVETGSPMMQRQLGAVVMVRREVRGRSRYGLMSSTGARLESHFERDAQGSAEPLEPQRTPC